MSEIPGRTFKGLGLEFLTCFVEFPTQNSLSTRVEILRNRLAEKASAKRSRLNLLILHTRPYRVNEVHAEPVLTMLKVLSASNIPWSRIAFASLTL